MPAWCDMHEDCECGLRFPKSDRLRPAGGDCRNAFRRLFATASAGWRRSSRRRKHAGAPGLSAPQTLSRGHRAARAPLVTWRPARTRDPEEFGLHCGGGGAGISCPRQARRPGGPAASRHERDRDYGAIHRAACMRRGHLWERRRPLGASRPALHGHGAASGSRAAVTRPEKCVTVDRSAARAMARESV